MARGDKLYDSAPFKKAREQQEGDEGGEEKVADAAPKDDEITFARWMQASDSVRKASGVPVKSKKELYDKWLKMQGDKPS